VGGSSEKWGKLGDIGRSYGRKSKHKIKGGRRKAKGGYWKKKMTGLFLGGPLNHGREKTTLLAERNRGAVSDCVTKSTTAEKLGLTCELTVWEYREEQRKLALRKEIRKILRRAGGGVDRSARRGGGEGRFGEQNLQISRNTWFKVGETRRGDEV